MSGLLKRLFTICIICVLVSLAWTLGGCVTTPGRAVAGAAKSIVAGYCAQSPASRALTREMVAAEIYPQRVEIHCEGDQE